jgi:hypothetical protein
LAAVSLYKIPLHEEEVTPAFENCQAGNERILWMETAYKIEMTLTGAEQKVVLRIHMVAVVADFIV